MRHLLNFVPTVKYRSGSSFMFRTIIVLLYTVPTLMTCYMGYRFFAAGHVIARLDAASTDLEKATAAFQKKLAESRPDGDELATMKTRLLTYHHTIETLKFSWNDLYKTIETILPPGIRLTRIRILPKTVLRITLEGNARSLEDVTGLLRSLYTLDQFANPRLTRHAALSNPQEQGVSFNMDVDYLPTSGKEAARP
ncbi:MAG TPA: PilN domain-containing protein [Candidatus Ozemobacteraceae bacterium]|nr:PilN domain-containing protein [Candidatus Ozemobacteraceae bacterium]